MSAAVISHFRERPKTTTAWWAMGLGLATFLCFPLLGTFAAVVSPLLERSLSERTGTIIGFGVAIFSLLFPIAALVMGIRAYRKGERSWVMWTGFVPAMLVCAFWVFMIVGEFVFPH